MVTQIKENIIRMDAYRSLKPEEYLFTSESVSEGHPDKICDQISDTILDAFLAQDAQSRVAIETLVTTNRIIIAGEVRSHAAINKQAMEALARDVVRDIGYEQEGFHWQHAQVEVLVHEQSADIARGVDAAKNKEEGAGDQGLMFGFACDETDVFMPAPICYAHRMLKALADARHAGETRLGPDSKGQITMVYRNGMPERIASVLVSTQHQEGLTQADVRQLISPIVKHALPEGMMCDDAHFLVNPTGQFVIGGPDGDCGLTGRKIIVDSYGGAAPHGGGAFSGKDPTKVDRSAAYMARYLAKNIVAAGLARQCEIQLAYAIGVAQPVSFYINNFQSDKVDNRTLEQFITKIVDLTPKGIRTHLNLNRPIYRKTASYGHFGRIPDAQGHFPWERLDLVDQLKTLL